MSCFKVQIKLLALFLRVCGAAMDDCPFPCVATSIRDVCTRQAQHRRGTVYRRVLQVVLFAPLLHGESSFRYPWETAAVDLLINFIDAIKSQ